MGEGEYDVKISKVQVNAIATQIVNADPRRVYLAMSQLAGAGPVQLCIMGVPAAQGAFPLNTNSILDYWYRRHGPLCSYGWQVVGGSVPASISIIEVLKLQ